MVFPLVVAFLGQSSPHAPTTRKITVGCRWRMGEHEQCAVIVVVASDHDGLAGNRRHRLKLPPEFPLTLPFRGCVHHLSSPDTFLSLKPLSISHWNGSVWCQCCVCLLCMWFVSECRRKACIVHVCVGEGEQSRAGEERRGKSGYSTENTRKRNKKGEQKRWKHGGNRVGNTKKTKETMGKLSNMDSVFLVRCGQTRTPKRSENGHFSRRMVSRFPTFYDLFRREVLLQTAKNTFLGWRSFSKGPNHALENGPNQRNTLHFASIGALLSHVVDFAMPPMFTVTSSTCSSSDNFLTNSSSHHLESCANACMTYHGCQNHCQNNSWRLKQKITGKKIAFRVSNWLL